MSLYLTIPVADGTSLANATLHTQGVLTGLTSGVSYNCYLLTEALAPFTYTGPAVPIPTAGIASMSGGNVTISVAQDGRSYEITVAEGAGAIGIDGTLYAFDTADILGKAPVILEAPAPAAELPEDLSLLAQVDYVPAPYLFDPAGGVPAVMLSTLRSGEVLSEGLSHALTDLDRVAGIDVRQEVINGWGMSAASATVIASLAYTPSRLTFGTTNALVKSDGVEPGGAESILAVVNAVPDERSGTFFRDTIGTRLRAYFSSQSGRVFTSGVEGKLLLNYSEWYSLADAFAPGDHVGLFIYARSDYAIFVSYRNGQALRTWSRTYAGATEKVDTTQALTIGYTDFSSWKDYAFKGGMEDLRIWTDLEENLDITTRSFADLFMDEAGTAKNPEIANHRFGQPKIWLPTNAAQANALTNLGTAGDFTSKLGVFA